MLNFGIYRLNVFGYESGIQNDVNKAVVFPKLMCRFFCHHGSFLSFFFCEKNPIFLVVMVPVADL